jgi:hypothetical protein
MSLFHGDPSRTKPPKELTALKGLQEDALFSALLRAGLDFQKDSNGVYVMLHTCTLTDIVSRTKTALDTLGFEIVPKAR